MASQTGSIDLTASNGVKLMAEAGFTNAESTYATKSALGVQADRISMVVENSDASGNLTLTADALEYIGDHVEIKGTDGTSTVISGGQIQTGSLSIGSFDSSTQTAISNGAKTATDYVTDINDNGITVHPKRSDYATNGGRAVINADGLTVYLGSDDVASYGASARIGKSNSDRVTVDSTNGITIYKGNSKRLQTTANGIDVYGSDGTTNIASFGATARIGKSNGTRVTIDTSEVKIIPSNKTSNALTFSATDNYASIGYGNNYLNIGGDVELGYDCALGVLGDLWVSSGGSLNVGSSAASSSAKFSVGSNGYVWTASQVEANYQLIAHDDTTSTDVALRANTAGNRGVYDVTNDKWILFRNYNNNELYLGGSADPLHHYTNTCTVNSTNATIYNSVNYCWHNNAACTVYLSVNLKSSLANGNTVDVATAPENYRPPYAVMGSVYVTGQNVNLQAEILGAGTIRVNNRSGSAVTTSANIYMSFTFAL